MREQTAVSRAHPDDRKTGKGAALAAISGIATGFVLSFAYSPLGKAIPIVYVNLIVTVIFGYLVGAACRAVIRLFRIDRPGLAFAAGLVAGLFAWYFAWATYWWVYWDYNLGAYTDGLFSFFDLRHLIQHVARNPIWTIGKAESGPWFYYLVWSGEFLVIAGASIYIPLNFLKEHRLCETCKEWLAATGEAVKLQPDEADPAVLDALKRHDFSVLPSFRRLSDEDLEQTDSWLEVHVFACPNCKESEGFIDVLRHTVKRDRKGGEKEKSTRTLGRQIPISRELEDKLFPAAPAWPNPAAADAKTTADGNG
ncbi:MAG: hypothetical protein LBT97_07430 [Planctomycetota bacterium]|jgi:hypothetical protein|nr:hypothetical protein [Planctomycetota bacterium]